MVSKEIVEMILKKYNNGKSVLGQGRFKDLEVGDKIQIKVIGHIQMAEAEIVGFSNPMVWMFASMHDEAVQPDWFAKSLQEVPAVVLKIKNSGGQYRIENAQDVAGWKESNEKFDSIRTGHWGI